MADIDKAVELARRYLDTTIQVVDWAEAEYARSGGCEECRDVRSPTARRLAEAVLAMAPVVTLARMQATARDALLTALRAGETAPDDEDAWSCAAHHTETAVRTLDAEARRG